MSISNAHELHTAVRHYRSRPGLSPATLCALDDCSLLSELNVDSLTTVGVALNSYSALDKLAIDDAETELSAVLTNQETCLDSLRETSSWRVEKDLAVILSNGTNLYTMSASFFSLVWVAYSKKKAAAVSSPPPSKSAVTVIATVVVSKNGFGNYTTIGKAVASAPNNTGSGRGYYLIHVRAGVYEEFTIPLNKKFIMMVGDGINRTMITGNHSVGGSGGNLTTFKTATFTVLGKGFVAKNITFRNNAGPEMHQAVALLNEADMSAFYVCSFEGFQDTLYVHNNRQLYRECDVYGTVDYIFGDASVVFQRCRFYSRLPLDKQHNTVTAQGRTKTSLSMNTGLSIQSCSFLAADDLAAAGGPAVARTYLGRPWKEFSRTVVMESFIGELVDPAGWLPLNGSFALDTLYYAEYNNTGPRADTSRRVSWPGYHPAINATDAANFTVDNFLDGDSWLPATGVAHDGL